MKFSSTRNTARDTEQTVTLGEAITRGIAPDGGLYVPQSFPQIEWQSWQANDTLAHVGAKLIAPFAQGDSIANEIPAITADAFNFDAPLVELQNTAGPASVLELFHGPTCAFKDFGARFLAATLQRVRVQATNKLTILVATSGDTGGAVAAAFHRRAGFDVIILYPQGLVSERQAQQLACWGDNVRTFQVRGTFDDCQRIVKEAFADNELSAKLNLSSANSINVGRLLPQMSYYARASVHLWQREQRKPNFIIPTGNLGNALACVWARHVGLPIGDIVLATNANRTVTEYLSSGQWEPRTSVPTLASAMDVGNPSNMERLRSLHPDIEAVRGQVSACGVSDQEIRDTIRRDAQELNQIWCPHTATAAAVYRRLSRDRATQRWVLVSTAHPAKFNDIVEPLIGQRVPIPPALEKLLQLPRQEKNIGPTLAELRRHL